MTLRTTLRLGWKMKFPDHLTITPSQFYYILGSILADLEASGHVHPLGNETYDLVDQR